MAVVYIDIENAAGQKQGNGPITSAVRWRTVMRMDKAGSFEFEMPARDPKAALVTRKRIARCWAVIDGQRVEMGAGVIDNIKRAVGEDGLVALQVSGDDLLRELTYRSVLNLKLYDNGNSVSHAAAVTAVAAFAPVGWTFTADGTPANDSVYGYFNGETVLAGMVKIAQKSQNHFYRGSGRSLVFASSFTPSGVRAIQARGDLAASTCAITSLTQTINTFDEINRIYPRGSGNAEVQLTLKATTRTAPAGYTLNTTDNYIQYDAGVAEQVIERQVDFRDIGPIANTDADIVAASNMLFDAGLEALIRRGTELVQAVYEVQLEGCRQLLRPLQSILIVYRNTAAGLNVNSTLNILESTWQVDEGGAFTTGLKVSNVDRWPRSDVGVVVDGIEQGQLYQALPQLNANSYVVAYNKNVDADHTATFRFRFGNEVTQLQQVLFEFQLLPFESTMRSVGGATSGSGQLNTTVPSTNTSGNPSNNTSGVPSSNTSGAPSNNNSSVPSTNLSSVPSTNTSGTPSSNTSGTPSTNTSGTPSTNTSGTPSVSNTGTPSVDDTGSAEGGDIDVDGFHQHAINVIAGAGSLGEVSLHESGGLYFLANAFVTGSEPVYVTPGGDHTHDMSDHTHTLNGHTHDMGNHTHTMGNHTHDLGNHTHTMGNHTHDLGNHTHDLNNHTHTLNNHSHDLGNHTHNLSNHIHDLSEALAPLYGIFRESEDRTYGIDDLEYRVNGGSWADLDTADDVGDGWFALDITSQVQDATTFRPLQTNNTIDIRPKTGVLTLDFWGGSFGDVLNMNTTVAHGLNAGMLPLVVEISGAGVGTLGSDINGTWTLISAAGSTLVATGGTVANGDGHTSPIGTVTPLLHATIDAQLSVRNTIQAVAYV